MSGPCASTSRVKTSFGSSLSIGSSRAFDEAITIASSNTSRFGPQHTIIDLSAAPTRSVRFLTASVLESTQGFDQIAIDSAMEISCGRWHADLGLDADPVKAPPIRKEHLHVV